MEDNEQQTIACPGPGVLPAAPACVVVIHGEGFGQRADIRDEPVVVGRSSDAALCIRSPSVSRRHCELRRCGEAYVIRDLGSTNGTRIGDHAVREARLSDGDQITIGGSILKFISHANVEAAYHERVSRLLFRDQLTGLMGRQDFVDAAEQRISDSLGAASPLSLALLDIEDIPGIQLAHGDEASDAVLAHVARLACTHLEEPDLAARIGEARFALLLTGRGLDAALAVAADVERQLREALEREGRLHLQVSVRSGAAQLGPATGSLGQLIKQIHGARAST